MAKNLRILCYYRPCIYHLRACAALVHACAIDRGIYKFVPGLNPSVMNVNQKDGNFNLSACADWPRMRNRGKGREINQFCPGIKSIGHECKSQRWKFYFRRMRGLAAHAQ